MSVVAVHLRLNYADFLHFPDDGLRRELIDGVLFVTPAPNPRHQRVLLRLAAAIQNHVSAGGAGEVFVAPIDVVLSDFDVVEPDLVFVAASQSQIITDANIQGLPLLVAEIISDPSRDRGTKLDLYRRFGIEEYWIVDPLEDSVEVYVKESGSYPHPTTLTSTDVLTTAIIPGLVVDLRQVFAR